MSEAILHRIEKVEPKPGYRLLVTWTTGAQTPVDFAADVKGRGVWAELNDEGKFTRARVVQGGRVLEWPEPRGTNGEPTIDVDADGLFQMAMEQHAQTWFARILARIRELGQR